MKRILLTLPLLLLASCTDDTEQVGMTVVDGEPVAVVTPCQSQEVASIEILLTARSSNPGDDDDQVSWRAVARDPGAIPFATPIGQAPDGFHPAVIPLLLPLRDDLHAVRQVAGWRSRLDRVSP